MARCTSGRRLGTRETTRRPTLQKFKFRITTTAARNAAPYRPQPPTLNPPSSPFLPPILPDKIHIGLREIVLPGREMRSDGDVKSFFRQQKARSGAAATKSTGGVSKKAAVPHQKQAAALLLQRTPGTPRPPPPRLIPSRPDGLHAVAVRSQWAA
jgi:DNA polymerase delta subunit 4